MRRTFLKEIVGAAHVCFRVFAGVDPVVFGVFIYYCMARYYFDRIGGDMVVF
jgi:hypothetical protein